MMVNLASLLLNSFWWFKSYAKKLISGLFSKTKNQCKGNCKSVKAIFKLFLFFFLDTASVLLKYSENVSELGEEPHKCCENSKCDKLLFLDEFCYPPFLSANIKGDPSTLTLKYFLKYFTNNSLIRIFPAKFEWLTEYWSTFSN